ncbi:MAG: citrate synthase [Ruminococcaceae bacterium]|nr:citrate synthase [Oscillospiraceae bacterium]
MAYLDHTADTYDAENAEILDELVAASRKEYQIPSATFDNYRVKRGLREPDGTGVMAGVTRICNAHGYIIDEGERTPVDGRLYYRGYRMSDLCENFVKENRFGFAECCYLLFFGHLPTAPQLERFTTLLDRYARLPARFDEDILMKAPSPSIMNKMATGVLSLYAYDDNPDETSLSNMIRQSMQLVARLPVIAAHTYAVYRNVYGGHSLNLHNPKDGLATAENFLRMLRPDKQYTEEEARLLDLCLVIHAEHGGGNNSSFACRVLSSSGTDTYSAIGAAIGSLKGPRHGGANLKVQEMFDCIKENVRDPKDDEEMMNYLSMILRGEANDHTGLIYGMGHAIYTKSDPRAVMLKKHARKLAEKKGYGDDFALLESIERLTPEVFRRYKGTNKEMCANVDLYSGLIYRMLNIPTCMYTPLFAIARVSGWCAHRIEEYTTAKKIIRPAYKCITERQEYIPLNERT